MIPMRVDKTTIHTITGCISARDMDGATMIVSPSPLTWAAAAGKHRMQGHVYYSIKLWHHSTFIMKFLIKILCVKR